MTIEVFREVTKERAWARHAQILLRNGKMSPEASSQFGTYWIEAGHHIREQIGNDQTLVTLLRHVLPPYDGTEITLYRGENRARWERNLIGLAWTSNPDTARMFGSGLNAVRGGGVLLQAIFQPSFIISGPNSHSEYLGESQFSVDPALPAGAITPVEFYPHVA